MNTEDVSEHQSEMAGPERLARRTMQLLSRERLPLPDEEAVTIILYSTRPDWTSVCISTLSKCTRQRAEIFVVPEIDMCSATFAQNQGNSTTESRLSVHFLEHKPAVDLYNLVLSSVKTTFVVLLTDSVIVTPDWLTRLLWPFYDDPKTGITGPSSNFAFDDTKRVANPTWSIGQLFGLARGFSLARLGTWNAANFLDGACLVCRRSLISEIGGLDFSLRQHETRLADWCLRVKQTNWTFVLCHDVFACVLQRTYPGTQNTEAPEDWKRLCRKWGIAEPENIHAVLTGSDPTGLSPTPPMIPLTHEALAPPLVTLLLLNTGEEPIDFEQWLPALVRPFYTRLEVIHICLGNRPLPFTDEIIPMLAATISLPKHRLSKEVLESAWRLANGMYIAYLQVDNNCDPDQLTDLIDAVHRVRAQASYSAGHASAELPLSSLVHLRPSVGCFDFTLDILPDGRVPLRQFLTYDTVPVKSRTIQASAASSEKEGK